MLCGAFFAVLQNNKQVGALTSPVTDETATIEGGDIWKGNHFSYSALEQLIKQITNNDNVTESSLQSYANRRVTANAMYSSSKGGKKSSTDITFNFGGEYWQAVYLSVADNNFNANGNACNLNNIENGSLTKKDDIILTIWQAYGTNSSQWNLWAENNINRTFPSTVYGTSYIRNVALNVNDACGYVATNAATTLTPVTQNPSNRYAKFTMSSINGIPNQIVDYITRPSQISWQSNLACSVDSGGLSHNYFNEAYDAPRSGSWMSASIGQQANKPHYRDWANDLIWLPCLSELGHRGNGFWDMSTPQRTQASEMWLRTGEVNTTADRKSVV